MLILTFSNIALYQKKTERELMKHETYKLDIFGNFDYLSLIVFFFVSIERPKSITLIEDLKVDTFYIYSQP